MSRSPMPPQLPPSVPPRPVPAQDGRTRYMEPAVDTGGPSTMPVTWPTAKAGPSAQAEQSGQPVAHPLAGQPANPPQPAVEPRPAEPSAGVVAEAVAEAAPAPLDPTTETPRRAGWIGWVLAAAVVAVAAAASYAAFGLVPVVISTAVPLAVAQTGIVLLLLALAVAVIRRRLRLAEQRGRRQAQELSLIHI